MVEPHTLRRLIRYSRVSGELRWERRGREHFSTDRAMRSWNARYAGAVCGRIVDGYVRIRVFGREYSGHRIAWAIHHGLWPDETIDHCNGQRADNRLGNLRDVTRAVNASNKPLNRRNRTGYPGVQPSWGSRWYAQIQHKGRRECLGHFATFEEAKAARIAAECRLGFIVRIAA